MTRPNVALQPPVIDRVTAVLRFVDDFSLKPVSRGVSAVLWDPIAEAELPFRMIRNLSGDLVLLNQPGDVEYTFIVDPSDAGYQIPKLEPFTPDVHGTTQVVRLIPRPDFPFGDGTTLIRGIAVRTAGDGTPEAPAAVSDLDVSVVMPQRIFATRTDERGAFALAVRLPQDFDGEETPEQSVTLDFVKSGVPDRHPIVTLTNGRRHVFKDPIDLDQTTVPEFALGQN